MSSTATRRRALRVLGGLAVGALLLSGCGVVGGGGGTEPDRDDEGRVTESVTDGDVFAIQVGDCLGSLETGEVSEVSIVPCDEPHDSEAFEAFDLADGEFPGQEAIESEAAQCQELFEAFVGTPLNESSLLVNFYSPTEESWEQRDDREILCLVYDPEGQTTGTLEGSEK